MLRHQLAVLRRQVARLRFTPADWMLLAALAKLLPRDLWPVFLVTPSALLRRHRELIRRRWTYPGRQQLAGWTPRWSNWCCDWLARTRWGYLRIAGECRKLDVRVSATSVRNLLRRHRLGPRPPGTCWWTSTSAAFRSLVARGLLFRRVLLACVDLLHRAVRAVRRALKAAFPYAARRCVV